MDKKKCPACDSEVKPLLSQPPLENTSTGTFENQIVSFSTPTFTTSIIRYGPTSQVYKCSNEECWVTKITESWE